MNRRIWLAALTALLTGAAGAQTQDYCSVAKQGNGINLSLEGRPTILGSLATNQLDNATFNIPLNGGPDGTLNDSVNYGGTTINNGDPELYYYGNGAEFKGDQTRTYTQGGQTYPQSTGAYTWSDIEAGKAQIIYLKVQARQAGAFGIGRGSRMELSYQGVPYARFDTRPNTYNYAPTITALNGASLRGRNGEAVPVLITTLTNTGPFWEYFVVLPSSLTGTGDVKLSFSDVPPLDGSRGGSPNDDIFFTVPRVYGGGMCLQERDTVAGQNYQISGSNADNLNYTLNIAQANTNTPADPTFKTVIEESQPISINSQNVTTPGARVTGLQCTKSSSLPSALRPEFSDRATLTTQILPATGSEFRFAVSGLDVGVIADCLVSNDSSQRYPTVTVSKNLPERVTPTDQFTVSASSPTPGNTSSAQTSGTATSAQTALTVRPTYTSTSVTGGTAFTENALPGSITIAEAALGSTDLSRYQSTLNCTRTSGTVSGLPTNQRTTSATLSGLTYNDAVSCTFLNAIAPTTNVSVTKTGDFAVRTAGQTTTYTVTVTNAAAAATVDVLDTLTLTPAGSTATVTASDGGVYDAATRTVRWSGIALAASGQAGSTRSFTVTVQTPGPTASTATQGQRYSGPVRVSNVASVQTASPNNGTSTTPAVVTDILFAQIDKTVQNVTQGGGVGTTTEAKTGDTLRYCLNFQNRSLVPVNLRLTDTIASTQSAPTNFQLTRTDGGSTAVTNNGGSNVDVAVPGVAANASGQLCFNVTVNR